MSLLKINDLLRISFRQVMRERRRYLGVFISIALGTAGIIVILTMGRTVKKNLNNDLTLIGGATIIRIDYQQGVDAQDKLDRFQWFQPGAIQAVADLTGVDQVSVSVTRMHYVRTILDNDILDFPLMGVDAAFWTVSGHKQIAGRYFTEEEVSRRESVCVVGERLAMDVFGTIDVSGREIEIENAIYRITGVLGEDTAGDLARNVFLPITTAEDRMTRMPPSNTMLVRCKSWDDVEQVAEAIPSCINKFQSTNHLRIQVPLGQLTQVKRIAFWVESFIYFSVFATLTLGGYGIWNGMMTAVRSRTREIGLKKAMGAEDTDIMFQFLSEALCLSLGGGLLGILLGLGGVEYTSRILESRPSGELVLTYCGLSIVFSLVLGIVAGYYPATRASRLEVVTAIRYE